MSNNELTSSEQSVLNSTVFTALCSQEIWSIIGKLTPEQRSDVLHLAFEWSITHSLCDDPD